MLVCNIYCSESIPGSGEVTLHSTPVRVKCIYYDIGVKHSTCILYNACLRTGVCSFMHLLNN